MTRQTDNTTPKDCQHPCCANCRFYDDQAGKSDFEGMQVGYCRRYAPRPFTVKYLNGEITDQPWTFFPLVMNDEFCGEFEGKTMKVASRPPWQEARMRTEAPQNAQNCENSTRR